MSSTERICKNCGAVIPDDERVCPNCGRLSIDSGSTRLGSTPPPIETPSKPAPRSDDSTASEAGVTASDSRESSPPEEGPKPDSFYAIAPATPPPDPSKSSSGGGSTCCNPCAVLFIVIGWLATLFMML
ncbi:MAG: zinc-ribbon domain-containing protein [Candidatus Thorarchaeota archaeon]